MSLFSLHCSAGGLIPVEKKASGQILWTSALLGAFHKAVEIAKGEKEGRTVAELSNKQVRRAQWRGEPADQQAPAVGLGVDGPRIC